MATTKNATRYVSEVGAEKSYMERITNDLTRLSIDQIDPLRPRKLTKKNIAREFNKYFGDVSKLANWQRFCQDIGLNVDELTSLSKCKQVRNPFALFHLFL